MIPEEKCENLFQPDFLGLVCNGCDDLAEKCRSSLVKTYHAVKGRGIAPTIPNIFQYLSSIKQSSPKDVNAAWGRIALSLHFGSNLVSLEDWAVLQDQKTLDPKWVVITLWNAPWKFDEEIISELGRNIKILGIQDSVQPVLHMLENSNDKYAMTWVTQIRQSLNDGASGDEHRAG